MTYSKFLKEQIPLLGSLPLGHTPFQIEYFKTSQQRGSPKFEYRQHLIQIKALVRSIEHLELDIQQTELEIEELKSFWVKFRKNKANRIITLKRLEQKLQEQLESHQDKMLECKRHVDLVVKDYSDLLHLSDVEILEGEEDYWVTRLSRQMALTKFAMENGLSAGDLQAVASLPPGTMQKIILEAQNLLKSGVLWKEDAPKLEE